MTPPLAATPGTGATAKPGYQRAILVTLGLAALAAGLGALGLWLSPEVSVRVQQRSLQYDESTFDGLFGEVAVYALIGFGYGIIVALISWFGLKGRRGPIGLGYTVVVSVAGSALALGVGSWLAHALYPAISEADGDYRLTVLAGIKALGVSIPWILLICAPLTAVITYLVLTLVNSSPDLGVGDLPTDCGWGMPSGPVQSMSASPQGVWNPYGNQPNPQPPNPGYPNPHQPPGPTPLTSAPR